MGLTDRLKDFLSPGLSRDQWPQITWQQYAELVNFGGNTYLTGGALSQTIKGHAEEIDTGFDSLIQAAYRGNGVVFACELARIQLFSEARFQYQRLRNGRPGELFGSDTLGILEHPWPTAITGDLLTRALLDADFGGTAFNARRGNIIRRLRPDWVTMVLGSERDPEVEGGDIDADVLGVLYYPGGKNSGRKPEALLRNEISIFAPIPDPLASFRGMPWVVPVLAEIIADKQLTAHKSSYLVNGATPNLTVAIDKDLKEAANPAAFAEWVAAFKKTNDTNAWEKYKTWYLAGGTTVTKVGSDMNEIDFKQVQGAGETRIAAAAGVPPVIVGLSEGLQAATYSNYGQARRRFADNTMRPLWRNMAGSLETIVPPPSGSRLWYDDRDIQALAEDKKDLAEVRNLESQQIRTLTDAGFTPESVVEAVTNGDFSRLSHTNLFSVQLQPPMPDGPPKPEVPQIAPPKEDVPKREALLLEAMRALATRPITVNAPITVEPTNVTVEPTNVTVEPTAVNVTPPSITIERAELMPVPVPMRSVIDRDDEGRIVGDHEEPL